MEIKVKESNADIGIFTIAHKSPFLSMHSENIAKIDITENDSSKTVLGHAHTKPYTILADNWIYLGRRAK